MERAKKGDRVKFFMDSQMNYGVVAKGGAKNITVITDGAKSEIKGGVKHFSLSDHPLPKDTPNLMDKYSVKSFKSGGMNTDGEMWSCTICKDDKPFAHVAQGGFGGPNDYQPLSSFTNKDIQAFMADAKEWAKLFDSDMIEPEDSWVIWWNDLRPYGQTAKEYFKEYKELGI